MTARDQIIETTCALMELQGYHATGLNEIIQRSGSPKGSLYYYFPGGKEALTAEALEHVGRIVLERIRTHLAHDPDPAVTIPAFIRQVARAVEATAYRTGGPITTVALETAATSERLRAVCDQIYTGWQEAVAEALRAGGFDAPRAHRLSVAVIAALEGGIILARTQHSPEPLNLIADEIGRLIAC
ncbi:TetR/AcrR family transcriptional regulator [Geitlerinema splendidum]|jgi:TetR/AcrR family transcriptional repressor of lmrAB and yxaGH operons|nr:TetR/AcrR family transcriptional regulator [Geitlerinema splendidum]